MPIKIPNNLPGAKILEGENVSLIREQRAIRQDIRPLQVLILNLMPDKIGTETQLLRGLGASPLQLEITLMQVASHQSKNTPAEHLAAFYKTHEDIKDQKFDAMLVTGAPLGRIDFEEVSYWDEVQEIFDWAKKHVHSTMFICWAAMAALYRDYGVTKHVMPKKKTGVYRHLLNDAFHPFMRGFDDSFEAPLAKNTRIDKDELVEKGINVLVETDAGEPSIATDAAGRSLYIFSHMEYDAETLHLEYLRDKKDGMNPDLPDNYFPNNNPDEKPGIRWRAHRVLLFTNWINEVYQTTPYDRNEIGA